jgi:hypothetical protein
MLHFPENSGSDGDYIRPNILIMGGAKCKICVALRQ